MSQALRMLGRDWRAGELRVLAAALVIAVASVTSVAFFGDRVSQALLRDAHQLLGADLALQSDHPWKARVAEQITGEGLQLAQAANFISMAFHDDRNALAGVKGVTENYPLRGKLRIAPDVPVERGPARGTVWLEERLISSLNAPVGSRIRLGRADFEVAAVLTLEPERSANFFNIAPRLMMNLADVPATGLIQTGSRVWYYLYAAGAPEKIRTFEKSVSLERGQRVDNLESGRPEVRASIERARRFLALTALLAAVLAGVAIALGTRRFVERHLDGCAVMRCLGATQRQLVALYGFEFALLGIAACAVGVVIGYAAQLGIAAFLAGLLQAELPPPGPLPALQGFLVGLVLLLGFALPPLLQLKNVPAVRVMRREGGAPKGSALAAYALGMAVLAALLIWQAGDLALGGYVVGGFTVAVLVFFALSWFFLRLLTNRSLLKFVKNRSVRYGVANLRRHARGNAVQVASLALGLTAVLLLTFTRHDLVEAWRRSAPPDAPNRFLLGVQPDQLAQVKRFLEEKGIGKADLYPMVRGRFVALNGKPVSEADYTEERARRLIERELNLSYIDSLPGHNQIVAGRWFDPKRDEISVEEGIAKTLGWKLGDELSINVGGESFSARITSLRKLRWDSMKVNFFVIAPPRLLAPYPASFISAFRVEPGGEEALNELAARFPNLTIVDVGAAVRQAQAVIDSLITAVEIVFVFALLGGLLVLYSALVATEDERRREAAVMRVYGASRAQVTGAQRAEFLAMGAIAGLLATLGAAAIGQLLARRVFELDLPPSLALWIAGPLAGIALLSLNAWLSSRKVLRVSPALTLRDSV
ncbi:MAG TPA: FtsX-like permease family protein [Burkholderiales bacterium]|nr:FtsX-like permease family protein [Burkholderiales bacterium]